MDIPQLIKKYETNIKLTQIMIDNGGLSEGLLRSKIRSYRQFIKDLKSLNEAIVRKPNGKRRCTCGDWKFCYTGCPNFPKAQRL